MSDNAPGLIDTANIIAERYLYECKRCEETWKGSLHAKHIEGQRICVWAWRLVMKAITGQDFSTKTPAHYRIEEDTE